MKLKRVILLLAALVFVAAPMASAQSSAPSSTLETSAQPAPAPPHAGGEANLVLPDLGLVSFRGVNARTLLITGLGVCVLGLAFGYAMSTQLRNLPVHRSMREISELIY
jgi:K(+)-stimulated pyrophosphate-energized sodium pump